VPRARLTDVSAGGTNSQLHAPGAHASQMSALTSGFQLAFLVAGLFAAAGAVIAILGLPRVPRRGRASRARSAAVEAA